MIYELADGKSIDTANDLTFEERNFIQKMLIYQHLNFDLEAFRERNGGSRETRYGEANQRWVNPSPAEKILLDLERKIRSKSSEVLHEDKKRGA